MTKTKAGSCRRPSSASGASLEPSALLLRLVGAGNQSSRDFLKRSPLAFFSPMEIKYYSCKFKISEGAGGFSPLKECEFAGPSGPSLWRSPHPSSFCSLPKAQNSGCPHPSGFLAQGRETTYLTPPERRRIDCIHPTLPAKNAGRMGHPNSCANSKGGPPATGIDRGHAPRARLRHLILSAAGINETPGR
jgi:hypothetical protein